MTLREIEDLSFSRFDQMREWISDRRKKEADAIRAANNKKR